MKKFFLYYLPYYKHYYLYFFIAFVGMGLAAAGTSATAYLVKPVLDDIFIEKDTQMLAYLPLLVLLAYSAKAIGTYVQAVFIARVGEDIIRRVRNELVSQLMGLDLAFFHRYHSGELISRVTNDIARIQQAVARYVAEMLRELLTAVALIGVVIYQSPLLAFYGLVVMPLAIWPLSVLAQKMKKVSNLSQKKNADLTRHLNEMLQNVEVIKVNATEPYESERFAEYNKHFFELTMRGIRIGEMVIPFMDLLGAAAATAVIYIGGQEVIKGEITVGAFFSFMTALFLLYNPIRIISGIVNKFQDAVAAHERLMELMQQRPQIVGGVIEPTEPIERIRFENVSLFYGDKQALDGISLEAGKGEQIALVGDSGGGKSSFVNLLVRFYDADEGEIRYNGSPIGAYELSALRKRIAMVSQRVYIFNDSVAANVAYGLPMNRERVEKALSDAHALEFVQALPEGIDTVLQEAGANLSGGQRQRIAIARAFYKEPDILILDEATSALDNQSEAAIGEALKSLCENKITFIIAHRLSTIEHLGRILVFKEGRIVCEGDQQSLLETCEAFRNLYRTGLS